jgi:High potential iron-sulfur protein
LNVVTAQHEDQVTRRRILKAGLGTIGSVVAVRAKAQEKIAQAVVQYQTQPKNGQMCSTCINFEPPGACKIIAGTIVPNGWCLVYAPKP